VRDEHDHDARLVARRRGSEGAAEQRQEQQGAAAHGDANASL
jgi:hypothetical protein